MSAHWLDPFLGDRIFSCIGFHFSTNVNVFQVGVGASFQMCHFVSYQIRRPNSIYPPPGISPPWENATEPFECLARFCWLRRASCQDSRRHRRDITPKAARTPSEGHRILRAGTSNRATSRAARRANGGRLRWHSRRTPAPRTSCARP